MKIAVACACFIALLSLGFAAVTVEQAADAAAVYVGRGESVNIQPQAKTYVGTDEYWIMELTYLGKIIVMIPINAETGEVVLDSIILPALKTHYLANYFATDDTIADFLDGTLSYAQNKKMAYQSALNQLQIQEPKIPQNASLQKYAPLTASMLTASTNNDDLRINRIIPAQNAISEISKPEDVDNIETVLDSVFARQSDFFSDIETVSSNANGLVAEVNSNSEMARSENAAAGQALIQIANSLPEDVTKRKDSLIQNKQTIDTFFAALDAKADDYLIKLQNRINKSSEDAERQAIFEKLTNITDDANRIILNTEDIPGAYQQEIADLEQLLNQTQKEYTDGNYAAAQDNFPALEAAISRLLPLIGTATQCTGNKEWDGTACTCPTGTNEDSLGKCVAPAGGFVLNWQLIGGIGAVVVVVLLLIFRKSGGKEEEKKIEDGAWQNYGWK